MHRLGMADEHRHAHAGRDHLDGRIEDLLRLVDHLPFLLCRAVLHEGIDMGNDVEGDLLGEFRLVRAAAGIDVARLLEQLVHARLAGAGDRLVGRDRDPPNPRHIVQRLERDDELDGRTVRVGDDVAPFVPGHVAGQDVAVHLRHHQRHISVHAELAGVVDDEAAGRAGFRRIALRDLGAGRRKGDVDIREIERREVLHLQRPAVEVDRVAFRARRRQRNHLVGRKLPFGQQVQHFPADIAGRADHGDAIAHSSCSVRGGIGA